MLRPVLIAATAALMLSGCGNEPTDATPIAAAQGQTTHAVAASRAGQVYRQEIVSPVTGDTTIVQVFEPTQLVVGETYPLVLEGHGYGGSRQTSAPDGSFIRRLNEAGYYVISIDQRGFGESSGTVRVMDPDFEGQNLIAVLDWAENLEGLRRRSNGEMVVGSYGGSYGGMYQFLLAGADPRQRLRVMAPDITPHDLLYALNPNNAIKSGWALALVAGGEASGLTGLFSGQVPTGLNQDLTVVETLLKGGLTNEFPEAGRHYFGYHSVRYFCDGVTMGEQSFLLGEADTYLVPPRPFPQIDALITQGFRDTLFNFNDGLHNYVCLRARGGDVRLLSHQSGHILPLTTAPLEAPLDPFYAALTLPNFQDGGGNGNCGSINLQDARFAWFEEKLQNRGNANTVITTQDNVCLSLADEDAISVPGVQRGGTAFFVDTAMPQLNSVLGIVGSLLGNLVREALVATQPLTTIVDEDVVLAGVPVANIDLLPLTGGLLEQDECLLPVLPLGCDPILYLGIGQRKAGTQRWDLVDDQLTPIRGFGNHQVDMTGIAERLDAGDELALLVYGFHLQYPITWSRDLLVPALKISGRVDLPLLAKGTYRNVP